MLRQVVDRDPATGKTRVRWVDYGTRRAMPRKALMTLARRQAEHFFRGAKP